MPPDLEEKKSYMRKKFRLAISKFFRRKTFKEQGLELDEERNNEEFEDKIEFKAWHTLHKIEEKKKK